MAIEMSVNTHKKDTGVQVLRAVLCVMIMLFHSSAGFASLFWGVTISFFLLSSYYLTIKVLSSEYISIIDQTSHRIRRLYPPYILIIIVSIVDVIARGGNISVEVIAYILSLQNFMWRFPFFTSVEISMGQIMAHTWTLGIEIWMGFLWTFLLVKIPRDKWKLMCYGGILWSVIWRLLIFLGNHQITWIYSMPFAYTDAFSLGTILALEKAAGNEGNKKAVVSCLIGITGIVATWIYLSYINHRGVYDGYLLFGGPRYYLSSVITVNIYLYLGLFFYGISSVTMFWNISENNPLVILGNHSYEMYLFHYPFLVILVQMGKWGNWRKNFVICFIGALICSIAWSYLNNYYRRKNKHDTAV
ncbi:acyltransferase family protein [Pseudobutyrivibrio xylanivorans]|uniref:Peptidoglycan/LPS O-acetylase OafA/YrhL, contains acyltransferase and SGNH-hydrolase domains n=1 Tax=Pseudobutyrivibrio xylanivorans TaxID=185007 RepID=A0A1G5S4X0_PSEXY|nr:acyltransferase [Pseudobutyrivibrio xylanivorans]SCZ81218.1 Peptidoglycan/LPS O-acetylase OafA/YrhL, contains acyltransferase and SGNH-hydrolase domains [Pseudobutyrivibrio xylanivorans]